MKSFNKLGKVPSAEPLAAEDITELHAGRILLLLQNCGVAGRVDGLTKLAKLDFFVRYPQAFERMSTAQNQSLKAVIEQTESPMVRHHYGPWDKRYYQILAYLEARRLITVRKEGKLFVFELSDQGKRIAEDLGGRPEFAAQKSQMKQVKKLLGGRSGTTIKKLIYEVFKAEVADRSLGEAI
jgi:hypothetical protein